MEHYKSIIAYDGSDFAGYQRQTSDLRTVQGAIEQALRNIGWRGESIMAAGRTDAGVHAKGQVISYDMAWNQGSDVLTRALNSQLPNDVAAWRTEPAPPDFHPRFSATRRHYCYSLLALKYRDPLRERYAWRVQPGFDLEAMEAAAKLIVGRHDFAAFGTAPNPDGHTVRQVYRVQWHNAKERYWFDIEADAFLYHMVRRLVSAMIAVGSGRETVESFASLIEDPEARWQGAIAPARGLCLKAVIYE
jgi:tRNA pseudouridine38-40 synthase